MYRNGKSIHITSGIGGLRVVEFWTILLLAFLELVGGVAINKFFYKNVMDLSWLYVVTIVIILVLVFSKVNGKSFVYISCFCLITLPIILYIYKPSVTYIQAQNIIKGIKGKEKVEVISEKASPGKTTMEGKGKNLIDKVYLIYAKRGDKLVTYIVTPFDGAYSEHDVMDMKLNK